MEFNNPSTLIKEVVAGRDARARLMTGINLLANSVKSTLGASGRTVGYQDAMGKPHVTKDGVTVAKSVIVADQVANMGCDYVKEAAALTVDEAGDGTTTATILARTIMQNAFDALDNKEGTIREITNGINKALEDVLEYLDKNKTEVTDAKLHEVAMISANNDQELGSVIAKAFIDAGANGEVLIEESPDETTYSVTETGSQFNSGLKSPYWRTDVEANVCDLTKPLIMIVKSPVTNLRKLEPALQYCMQNKRSLLIIGELENQPLSTLLSNVVKGTVRVNVVDAPGFGPTKDDTIADIGFMTGATPLSEQLGDDLSTLDPVEYLGEAERVITDNKKTVIQVSVDMDVDTTSRIEGIKTQISNEENGYIVKKLEERISILAGKVSVIKCGAKSKVELKEKKDRIEDAVFAVKAAIKEGIVPGGGVALLDAAFVLTTPSILTGEKVLYNAITAPFQIILENADQVLAAPVLEQVYSTKGLGVDVITGGIVDMVKHGIIDPVLVTKTALKNAVSVATTIISMDTIIANKLA